MPTILLLLLIAPSLAAIIAALIPSGRVRPWILPPLGVAHLIGTFLVIADRHLPLLGSGVASTSSWMRLDAAGIVVLLALSVLFLMVACYAPAYLRIRSDRGNRVLVVCCCLFLALASLTTMAQHLGLMWAALEGATLTCAPMIYFNHHGRSLEATWKYLLVGGVGIALALLGTFFLAYAAIANGHGGDWTYDGMTAVGNLSAPWLRVAFVLLLVGYGTKMGLAPLHTWKPDAYGESPGIAGALLAGGLTSIAFLALLRVVSLVDAAGQGAFAHTVLTAMGLLSVTWAAVFMTRQADIKRLLAYSSLEHMGILAIGLALGPVALPVVLLQLIGNAWAKSSLFLSAGNIHRAFASRRIPIIGGALLTIPVSAVLFLIGFLAATGAPPFSLFLSGFGLVQDIVQVRQWWTLAILLASVAIIFIGFSSTVLSAVLGESTVPAPPARLRDSLGTTAAPLVGLLLVLGLGLWIPGPLRALFQEAGINEGGAGPAIAVHGVQP